MTNTVTGGPVEQRLAVLAGLVAAAEQHLLEIEAALAAPHSRLDGLSLQLQRTRAERAFFQARAEREELLAEHNPGQRYPNYDSDGDAHCGLCGAMFPADEYGFEGEVAEVVALVPDQAVWQHGGWQGPQASREGFVVCAEHLTLDGGYSEGESFEPYRGGDAYPLVMA